MYDVFPSPLNKKYTISDHVREMYEGGSNIEQICWKFRLRQETVTQWLEATDNTYIPYVGGEI